MCNKEFNTPEESSRPFDAKRAGFILGEGSGILVLEELEHAKKRGAKIYAEVVSFGCSSKFELSLSLRKIKILGDGHHLTRPETTGDGAFRAMRSALRQGGISSDQLDHINTHATSTPAGDLCEARAIGRLLENNEDLLKKVSITANKSAVGHCFGAAGSVEGIFTVLSLYNVRSGMLFEETNIFLEPSASYFELRKPRKRDSSELCAKKFSEARD